MEMGLALDIALISALVAFILLVIFAIYTLVNVVKSSREVINNMNTLSKDLIISIKDIRNDIEEIKTSLTKAMDSFDITSRQITSTARAIEEGTEGFSRTIRSYTWLFDRIFKRISPPLSEAALYISAASKAFNAFTGFFGKK